jgi:hypothetical protein
MGEDDLLAPLDEDEEHGEGVWRMRKFKSNSLPLCSTPGPPFNSIDVCYSFL